jgi:excisionase family DNA binding protein
MEQTSLIVGQSKRLLKAVEVAEILNVSRAFAYRLMQIGEIRTVTIGSARRVRPEDLQAFIEGCLDPPLRGDLIG